MAPLTLTDKYHDLIRLSNEPSTLVNKLDDEDLNQIENQLYPLIIRSITSTFDVERKIHVELTKSFRIDFQFYSKISREYRQNFPERIRQMNRFDRRNDQIYLDEKSNDDDLANLYVFCHRTKTSSIDVDRPIRSVENLLQSIENSTDRFRIIQYAIKECCRCGTLKILEKLSSAIGFTIEQIRFSNGDDFLHQTIKMNNEQLTIELLRRKFNVNSIGELGTPLITALHFNIYWAVELLLKHDADLTERHVDWPHWTIYQYCIQFGKIQGKLFIEKHLILLIQQKKYQKIERLNRSGWNIHWRRYCHRENRLRIN